MNTNMFVHSVFDLRRMILFLSCLLLPLSAKAQYENVKERTASSNSELQEFSSQQRVLWNFDWEFSLGTEQKDWKKVDLSHDFQWEQPWMGKNCTISWIKY